MQRKLFFGMLECCDVSGEVLVPALEVDVAVCSKHPRCVCAKLFTHGVATGNRHTGHLVLLASAAIAT